MKESVIRETCHCPTVLNQSQDLNLYYATAILPKSITTTYRNMKKLKYNYITKGMSKYSISYFRV